MKTPIQTQTDLRSLCAVDLALAFAGCREESMSLDNEIKPSLLSEQDKAVLTKLRTNTKITKEEAEAEAINIMSIFDKTDGFENKSAASRRISKTAVFWHTSPLKTKSTEEGKISADSIAVYTFNFSSNESDSLGYAVVVGDNRISNNIIATAAEGMLSDTITNDGLGVILSGVTDYLAAEVAKYEADKEQHLQEVLDKLMSSIQDSLLAEDGSLLQEKSSNYIGMEDLRYGKWETVEIKPSLVSEKLNGDRGIHIMI